MTPDVAIAVAACWLAAFALCLAAARLGVLRVSLTRPTRPKPPAAAKTDGN